MAINDFKLMQILGHFSFKQIFCNHKVALDTIRHDVSHILAEAVEEGGFYTDTYILTRNEHGRRTAAAGKLVLALSAEAVTAAM